MKIYMKCLSIIFIIFFCLMLGFSNNELEELKNNYYVLKDKINVFKEPNTASRVLYEANVAECVKIIKKTDMIYWYFDVLGQWIYIDTEYIIPGASKSIKGWILDTQVINSSKFKRIGKFNNCRINGIIGDWHMDYTFLKNGRYKKKKNKTNIYGNIYRYKNLLILKDDNSETFDFFYLDDNKLCHYFRDKDGKSICTECEVSQ